MQNYNKTICPKEGVLQKVYDKADKDNFHFKMNLLDEELDLIPCTFNGDECVTIDTVALTYIVLSEKNLLDMLKGIRSSINH
jgi:hypothetical protein